MNRRPLVLALVLSALCPGSRAAERIWVDAAVNGQPVRALFDTGCSHSSVTTSLAAKLGLKVNPPTFANDPDIIFSGETAPCTLEIFSTTHRTKLGVIELPSYLASEHRDRLIWGWNEVSNRIFRLDARKGTVTFLNALPPECRGWTSFPQDDAAAVLRLEIPDQFWTLVIDTGAEGGVSLTTRQWREWKSKHTNNPITMVSSYIPSGGFHVREESFARELNVCGMQLTEVPVEQASAWATASGHMIFGCAALKQLDFIYDGTQRKAYMIPKRIPALPYEHNRLGAVFVPRHAAGDQLNARVAPRSPAQAAGIRDGDTLVRVEDMEIAAWLTNRTVRLSSYWERPAGTRLRLVVKRGEETLKFNPVLRDILAVKQP